MKFVDEFRNSENASIIVSGIESICRQLDTRRNSVHLMEFCGGHTHSIFRYGLQDLLPELIELVHGPGCPVCVLPRGRIDDCIEIASRQEVIFTTFGDAMRVPGSNISLLDARAAGADIRMVYSPMDALRIARENPERQVVFLALGFETTMPATALTLLQAANEQTENFSLFSNHITTIPTIKALLDSPGFRIDGFIAPGHVSVVVGLEPFSTIVQSYAKPMVVSGFEPLDILQSILMLLMQVRDGRAQLENQYARVVQKNGNSAALRAVSEVFETRQFFEWRGLGSIDSSGIKIKEKYARFDAEHKFSIASRTIADPSSCQCGEVLKGEIKPQDCKLFGERCNPRNPMGALMVSSEGACAAYYNHKRV